MEWYIKVFKQYADFKGRARRKEFWMFYLFNIVISVVLSILTYAIGSIGNTLTIIYSFAILIPTLAVCVRRLHDIGKSGWMYLIILIPGILVGISYSVISNIALLIAIMFIMFAVLILFLVWFSTDSEAGTNKWGPNPKEENSAAEQFDRL